jgi:hypothetical protein
VKVYFYYSGTPIYKIIYSIYIYKRKHNTRKKKLLRNNNIRKKKLLPSGRMHKSLQSRVKVTKIECFLLYVKKKFLIPFLETFDCSTLFPSFAGSTSATHHVTFISEKKNKRQSQLLILFKPHYILPTTLILGLSNIKSCGN